MNSELQFFPHPEGYVSVVKFGPDNLVINYAYQYKDHLGNIRLNYGKDPETNVLKVLEENHYYPFGLKHQNYNTGRKQYGKKEDELTALQIPGLVLPSEEKPMVYKYKFQGQERQDELGLNWDSYKYRNYDYTIGRFMSIDPLAEEYNYQSPYNFAENRVIDHLELEGLEGIHHTIVDNNGNKRHVIEKNVVFLRQNPTPIPQTATPREAKKITRENNNTYNNETARINDIKSELHNTYSGTHKNSAGEEVTFQFNYKEVFTDNTDGNDNVKDGLSIFQFAFKEGITGKNGTAPATVFTSDNKIGGELGKTSGSKVFGKSIDAPEGTWSHEFIHTLGLPDNNYDKGGVLGNPVESLNTREIDDIIKLSIEAKF